MRWRFEHDPNMIRAWSEHDPSMNSSSRTRPYNISRFGYLPKFHRILRLPQKVTLQDPQMLRQPQKMTFQDHQILRLSQKVTLQDHQILRLPRKMMRIIDCRHLWNVIYNARSHRHHPPTSPNTAPATQNCTPKSKKNLPKTAEASIPMRGRFEHDPSMIRPWSEHELVISHPPVRRGYFSRFGDAFCIENYNISRFGYLPKFHRILRLPQKVTLQDSQTQMLRSHKKWHSKITKYCACHKNWHSKITKYCACHEKWCASLIVVTYETSFTMRGATGITLQPHQILRLPCKIALQNQRKICRKQLKRQFQCGDDSSMIRAWSDHDPSMNSSSRTRPFAEVTFRASETHFVLKITTFRASAIYPNFTEYYACPKKWHSKIPRCCASHKKWHSKITKYCACYKKWHSKITKYCACHEKMMRIIDCRILRLPRKIALQNQRKICRKQLKRQFQCGNDSSMIRAWSEHELVISHPPVRRGYFSRFGDAFCIENYNISRFGYLPKFHRILRLPQKVTLQDPQMLRQPQKMTLQDHQVTPRSPNTAPATKSETVTELLLNCYWAVTELLLNWTVSELLLSCYWTVTELSCYWIVTELSCYWTELLLNCYWTVTELSCYWTVTELTCYWTVTELLLNWTVTELLLSCYCSELLLPFLNLRNSEVSQLNFLRSQPHLVLWWYSYQFKLTYDRTTHTHKYFQIKLI